MLTLIPGDVFERGIASQWGFICTLDEAALAKAQLMDAKLMLVSNVLDLEAEEIVQRSSTRSAEVLDLYRLRSRIATTRGLIGGLGWGS